MNTIARVQEESKFLRQLGIFDPTEHPAAVTIVGAGGIGGPAALQLAKLGLHNIRVFDFDTVEEHNQPNQIFGTESIGKEKVSELQRLVKPLTDVTIDGINHRITPDSKEELRGIVISAVDSMEARKIILEKTRYNPQVQLLIDGRIGGETIRIYTLNPLDAEQVDKYVETLVPDSEAAELPCTERAVVDVGFFIGALITRAVRRYLKEAEITFEVIFDVRNLMLLKKMAG